MFFRASIVCWMPADNFLGENKKANIFDWSWVKYPRDSLYFNVFFVIDVWKPETKEL